MEQRTMIAAQMMAVFVGKYSMNTSIDRLGRRASSTEELRTLLAQMAVANADALLAELAKKEGE